MHPTRIFKTPESLIDVWEKYKTDLKQKAFEWPKIQYVGKDGERVEDFPVLPLTFEGLKRFCWEKKIGCVEQYFTNQDDCYGDFIGVCSCIKNEIREHQITGGLIGNFNPSITQRLNGLADKTELDVKGEPRIFNV
jgi:hypothetical protein